MSCEENESTLTRLVLVIIVWMTSSSSEPSSSTTSSSCSGSSWDVLASSFHIPSFILLINSAPRLRLMVPFALAVPLEVKPLVAVVRISSISNLKRSMVSLSIMFSCFCSSSEA